MADKANRPEPMSPERVIGQRIHAFSNTIKAQFFQRTNRPLGVNLPEWRVLRAIVNTPGISQTEIAFAEGLNVMIVSRAAAGLRTKGLVEMVPDPNDRRRTRLSATELGFEIAEDLGQRESLVYQHVFSVLSAAEIEQLDKLLDRVITHIRNEELPPPPEPRRDWGAMFRSSS